MGSGFTSRGKSYFGEDRNKSGASNIESKRARERVAKDEGTIEGLGQIIVS